jgi:enoyl-CoA hydratase/carnithine racemase
MSALEIERRNGIMVLTMNKTERLNAMGLELRQGLHQAWEDFASSPDVEVAIVTGAGRAFSVGEDMKESLATGTLGFGLGVNPFPSRTIDKPIIAAVNGFAMGAGFEMLEHVDFRVAATEAVFELSLAKRWLLGGYQHGWMNSLPHVVSTELAFSFRFSAQRMYEIGFLNRVVERDQLLPEAETMATHLLSLPPASRVNTLLMTRAMRPAPPPAMQEVAAQLRNHGAASDLVESRRAFAERRAPRFQGWDEEHPRSAVPGWALVK